MAKAFSKAFSRKEDGMAKTLGILIGGIFVGAVAMEVIRRKYPEGLGRLCASIRERTAKAKQAFLDGYRHAMQPEEAVEASA